MTVNRFRDGAFSEVNRVGKPLDDSSVKVRRDGQWVDIWPSDAIPDSAINQWRLDDVNSVMADSIGDKDLTNNALSSVSGDFVGGAAADGDGVDDHASVSYDEFGSTLDGSVTIAFTIETDDSECIVMGVRDTDGNNFAVSLGNSPSVAGDPDPRDVAFAYGTGGDPDDVSVYAEEEVSANEKTRVVLTKDGNDGGDIDIYYNGGEKPINVSNDGFVDLGGFDYDIGFFARNFEGSFSDHADATIDNIIFAGDYWDDKTVSDDFNEQPWS